jgi:perosamine synthetase
MSYKIPLFKIYWDKQDVAAVTKAIKRGMSWATGPSIQEFESRLAQYIGMNYAVTFNSGTSALYAVLVAHNVGKGDEVIVPSFTFIATANAPLFVGAKPVFADIELDTYGLDPADVERKITSKTKAILPIHYGGCPCLIKELRRIADRRSLLLIEDAAETFGAAVEGTKVGTFGDAAALSFCQNKIITTGEGGAVLTNSKKVHDRLKLFRSHGRLEMDDYFTSIDNQDYIELGYNFRMSNVTAALGIAQLDKVDRIIEMRRSNAEYMNQKLHHIEGVEILSVPRGFYHVYQMYTIRLKGSSDLRGKFMQHLANKGIMSKVYFHPVHLTQFYRQKFGYRGGELPVTERIASEVLTLPMYPSLTKGEMDYITEEMVNFFRSGDES